MAHGSGGLDTAELMRDVFSKHFGNGILARLEDSAVIDLIGDAQGGIAEPFPCVQESSIESRPCVQESSIESLPCVQTEPISCVPSAPSRIAISTDTFVVTPLVFPGGDIGKLAAYGTVNDVLMSGATPKYLTCGFIIETGLPVSLLDGICASLAAAAKEAGVTIVAGDTKVVEGRVEGGGLMINTTGVGVFPSSQNSLPSPSGIRPGDAIIVSGNLGDHHAAILSARLGIRNSIESDCALLSPIINALREAGVGVHAIRDVTRGGLGTILNELAAASDVSIALEEESIPVSPAVRAFCGIMGLDPLYMGNEGKLVMAVPPGDLERALAAVRSTGIGKDAALIGTAMPGVKPANEACEGSTLGKTSLPGDGIVPVTMRTRVGGTVRIDVLYGEGLPRIC